MFDRPLGFETRVISHVQGGGVKRDFRKVKTSMRSVRLCKVQVEALSVMTQESSM